MSPRYVILGVASVLVLGLGVYLFIAVRETPARAQTTAPAKGGEAHADRASVAPTVAANDDAPPADKGPAPTLPPAQKTVDKDPGQAQMPLGVGPNLNRPGVGAAAKLTGQMEPRANPKVDAIMDEANKAYDRGDYDEARAIAGKVLAKQPGNPRMLRILVTTACIDGDKASAQNYFNQLPPFDRQQMKTRCSRDNGITLDDPPAQQ